MTKCHKGGVKIKETNKNFPNAKVNLLSANNNTFNSLKQWDIQKENLNYVVEIICKNIFI